MKLFASIYQGTLRGNSRGLLVFTNLLAHCDVSGVVDIHPRSISEEVGLPIDDVRAALDLLESPDDESRSPEDEGRRIVRLDEHRAWGWRVVNYAKYRAIRNEEDRREQNRLSQERWRKKNKPSKPRSAQGEGEGEGEANGGKPPGTVVSSGALRKKRSGAPAPSAETWDGYSKAYAAKYGAVPVRNASVNACLAQFVGRIAADEAPQVAAFYLTHQNSLYAAAMHPVNLLLRDAEKLRTEWATGRTAPASNGNHQPQPAEPTWRTEQREHAEAFLGPYAKRRPVAHDTIDMEAPNADRISLD